MGDARTLAVVRKPKAGRAPPRLFRQMADRSSILGRRVQPALRVGAANDPLEHEAERTAERVVAMPAPGVASPPDEPPRDAGEVQARRAADQESQPNTDTFETAPSIPADHQDPDVPKTEDVDTAGLKQDEFGEIEEGEPTPPDDNMLQPAPDGAAVGAEGGAAPSDVAHRVAQPGTGRPLPAGVRAFMEPRFGVGFQDVRIHDAAEDRRTADRIGARAFTHRHHIWLGNGERVEDRRLLAHELTHVVQQTRRPALAGGRTERSLDEWSAQRAAEPQIRRGWLRNKAEKYARKVPGYFLLTVILGKSPITGNDVPRTAENLVGGFLTLLGPVGDAIFERLQESRALTNAFEWVSQRLSQLNITWSRVKGLVSDFIDEMPSTSPIQDAKRIFGPLVSDIITFVGEIKDKILEFIVHGALKLAGSWGERVWGVIQQARETISLILKDPLGFAKNLIASLVGGFKKFQSNIWKHLKAGLMAWLFGTMQGLEITMPEKLDFKGILSVALQIVGLTYANFRKILVDKLGRGGERKVAFLEKSVEVVKILVKEGFGGIWQRAVEAIDNFKSTMIDGIKNFVITSVVKGAISWIAGLSNPIGGIIKVALAIYNMIKAFLERWDQIMAIMSSIFSSISAIAKGQISEAIDFVEKALARAIPVLFAFVAAVIPIGGIVESIRGVIKKLSDPVKRAMTKLVEFFVKKAKKLFSKILGKINRKRELAKRGFVVGKKSHQLIPEKKGNALTLKIASEKGDADKHQADMKAETKKAADFGDDSTCAAAFGRAFQVEVDQAQTALAKVNPNQQKTPTKAPADKASAETADAGDKLSKLGPCLAENPFFETEPENNPPIIRAREPRIPEIEGDADLHAKRGAITSKTIAAIGVKAGLGARGQLKLSNYYENDHIPEKSLGFLVQAYVQGDLQQAIAAGERAGAPVPDPSLGDIDTRALGDKKKGPQLPAITVYRPIHRQKGAADAERKDHGKIIDAARAKSTPNEKIAALRAGVQAEMEAELTEIADRYSGDKAANEKIRAKVRAGMRDLGALNKELFGFEPGKAPTVKRGKKDAGPGTDLPMEGYPAGGIPNFADLEGSKVSGGLPGNVGTYLELDHVVEASLAEKARDLKLSDTALTGGLQEPVKARAAEQAAVEQEAAKAKPGEMSARTPAQIEAEAMKRLGAMTVAVCAAAANYKREAAGTVALYRPVHFEVSAKQQKDIKGDLVQPETVAEARRKLVEFAVSEPINPALRDQALTEVLRVLRQKFDGAITTHSDRIKNAYVIERKEFLKLNKSKEAAAKMETVIARVESTLSALRGESLNLLNAN